MWRRRRKPRANEAKQLSNRKAVHELPHSLKMAGIHNTRRMSILPAPDIALVAANVWSGATASLPSAATNSLFPPLAAITIIIGQIPPLLFYTLANFPEQGLFFQRLAQHMFWFPTPRRNMKNRKCSTNRLIAQSAQHQTWCFWCWMASVTSRPRNPVQSLKKPQIRQTSTSSPGASAMGLHDACSTWHHTWERPWPPRALWLRHRLQMK